MVRSAKISDARPIHKLLLQYARDGLVLPRSLSDIYEYIRNFYVFEGEGGTSGATKTYKALCNSFRCTSL